MTMPFTAAGVWEVNRVRWSECAALSVEVFLPIQFGARRATSPERALLAAVLDDAVRCAAAGLDSPVRREARLWIEGASARLPFLAVCQELGLDATAVRAAVGRMTEAPRRDPRHAGIPQRMRIRIRGGQADYATRINPFGSGTLGRGEIAVRRG